MVRLQDTYRFELDWRGFVLHPEVPLGGLSTEALFGQERAAAFRAQIERFASEFGVPIGRPARIPNTRRALALTEYARDRGRLHPFRRAVMEAHWLNGAEIESDASLGALAEKAELEPSEALAAADDPPYLERVDARGKEAKSRHITGIPTFFLGDVKIVGCQSFETLEIAADKIGFERR